MSHPAIHRSQFELAPEATPDSASAPMPIRIAQMERNTSPWTELYQDDSAASPDPQTADQATAPSATPQMDRSIQDALAISFNQG